MQVNTSVNTSMSSLLARITSKNTHSSVIRSLKNQQTSKQGKMLLLVVVTRAAKCVVILHFETTRISAWKACSRRGIVVKFLFAI